MAAVSSINKYYSILCVLPVLAMTLKEDMCICIYYKISILLNPPLSSQAFKSTPAFMMAVYRAKLTGKEFDLAYMVTPSYVEFWKWTEMGMDAAWIACGK